MGREARAVDIPRYLEMKGGDGEFHSARISCWFCDKGNDHTTSELMVIVDDVIVASVWMTSKQWKELSEKADMVVATFREDDVDDENWWPNASQD